jgi:hypothetical protein
MTELEAMKQAMGSLKAHGGSYKELRARLGDNKQHSAVEVVKACAELVRKCGHATCADGLLDLKWTDAPST